MSKGVQVQVGDLCVEVATIMVLRVCRGNVS
jgi:hypothetical protein